MTGSKYITFVVAVFLCLGFSLSAFAASPPTMTYHGELNSSGGKPVNATVEVSFRIFNAETDGTEAWSEPTSTLAVNNGKFAVQLGTKTPLVGVFDGTPYWLEISINGDPLSPRTPIDSVPYAFHANRLEGHTAAELIEAAVTAAPSTAGDLSYDNSTSGLSATSIQEALDELATLRAEVNALKTLTQDMKRETINDEQAVVFTGVNVHIRNGLDATETINGLGNLIVGYDEARSSGSDKSGSHNLVVGTEHNYTRYGGFVAGHRNTIAHYYASVSGGDQNTASGKFSSVSGGYQSTASGRSSSVSGGDQNTASSDYSSVSGGRVNIASGEFSSVSGGFYNTASGSSSSVSGGYNRSTTIMRSWRAGSLLENN